MLDLSKAEYFEPAEKLVKILINKTQNNNPLFFRTLVDFYFSQVASMMRCSIDTHDRGNIPVNIYAVNLSQSGSGKTYSSNIIEETVIRQFKEIFTNSTFLGLAEINLATLAVQRARKYNEDPDTMREELAKEFNSLGPLVFSFDSGTSPAVKQMRHKLLMAGAGSINLIVDEIGSNLVSNTDVLNTFLELYDVGKIKQKLVKNTKDNTRTEEIDGRTPTNMMLYGTPSKLLNGSKTEEEFYSMLETGYARRCLFGFSKKVNKLNQLTVEEVYDMLVDTSSEQFLDDLSNHIGSLADIVHFNKKLQMSKDLALLLIEYRLRCERIADSLKDHEEILKAEISHRYYKALKLSGAYAFIEGNPEITEDNLYSAIKRVEESGEAFTEILTRERNYEKLAKYIASIGKEVTQVDLVEDLPFYKGSEAAKRDLMSLAIAYGYKHNIIIKKSFSDGIEFFQGESMDETDLNQLICSYSLDIAKDYKDEIAPWDKLYKMVTADGIHYTAHHFDSGYRNASKVIPGFNLVIVDVDQGIKLDTARELLRGFKALYATTKRHTPEENRFRIIFPLSHIVKLSPATYSKFMLNVFNWLPFEVDSQTKDISRKWESFNGQYHYEDGELLDAMLFIPETKKQEDQHKKVLDHGSLDNLQRWFLFNTNSGNRNNQLFKLGTALLDSGKSFREVRDSVLNFNNQLSDPLSEEEIDKTIMVSIMNKLQQKP
jgi:hypothetical protein